MKIDDALKAVAATDEGRTFLRYLMHDLCGYDSPSLALTTTHEVSVNVVLTREAQRALWLDLRQRIPYEDLVEIELPKEQHSPVTEGEKEQCLTIHQKLEAETNQLMQEQEPEPAREPLHRSRNATQENS